jgi:hypothetical protein
MITVSGARVFVAQALIGEQVACVRLAQQLLVVYRTIYVREIDLKTGRTRSLLRPVDAAGHRHNQPVNEVLTSTVNDVLAPNTKAGLTRSA